MSVLPGGEPECLGVVPEEKPDTETSTRARPRDSFKHLSAVPREAGSEHNALPCCLILYVACLAVFCGFLVSGCHKAFVYSGCLLGINGCNSLNGYKYEKMGFIIIRALPEVPEEIVYIVSAVLGALLCGVIIACLPENLQKQVKGGGTPQSLVAVATGDYIPLHVAVLRMTLALLFLMSGGSMGAEGPSIQVCTSFAMLAGWYSGIRAAVTQSLLASLGFSCGFAASFNAPLAGITFAMEELQHVSPRLSQATIYMIMVAAAVSTAVARATAGNYQLFQPTWAQEIMDGIKGGSIDNILGQKMWMLIAVPIGVACSLCGYVISRSSCICHDLLQKYRPVAPTPVAFAAQALVQASLGALVFRVTGLRGVWGIGAESLDQAMREAIPLGHFVLFAIGKAVAFILGMAVRCPADILEPVLVTGGFVGGAIGCLLPSEALVGEGSVVMPCIIFGMVGLFASCFRFSLTPIVIVLEIVGTESYSLILPAVLCGFTAATCSDHLFPALLEDILAQDGIDLEELAAEAEESFEADEAAREARDSREVKVQVWEAEAEVDGTQEREAHRHGTTRTVKSESKQSAVSRASRSDSQVSHSDDHPRATSRHQSENALGFLRRGLEESLFRQSQPRLTEHRDGLQRSGSSRLARAATHRSLLAKSSTRHLTFGHGEVSAGSIEIPLQGLRSPVDLRFGVREVVDEDGQHKYFLQVSHAPAAPSLRSQGTNEIRDGKQSLESRSQSLFSLEASKAVNTPELPLGVEETSP